MRTARRVFQATVGDQGVEVPGDLETPWMFFDPQTDLMVEDNGDGTYTDHGCFATLRDGAEREIVQLRRHRRSVGDLISAPVRQATS